MYIHERLATVNTAPLYIFMFLLSITQAEENVNVYFSLQENRAIQGAPFISSFYAEDVMLCARSCAREFECNTANYIAAESRCDLSKERMENASNGAAMVSLRGCYLIIKTVKTYPQVTKDPAPSVTWLEFTPQWCTTAGRASFGNAKTTAEECKEKCKDGCLGVEWWQNTRSCYECTDPSKRTAYTVVGDSGYPPHVFLRSSS